MIEWSTTAVRVCPLNVDSRHRLDLNCANSGYSPTAQRMGQFLPGALQWNGQISSDEDLMPPRFTIELQKTAYHPLELVCRLP
jgi:hypothetical protein